MIRESEKETFPTVTILVPVYNTSCKFLNDLLISFQEQVYKDFDVIIVDDHSSVDYTKVIKDFTESLNIRYVKTTENIGMVDNWNYAASLVESDFFIVMGHDDVMSKNYLSEYIKNIDDDTVIVSSSSIEIDSQGSQISRFLNVNHRTNILKLKKKYIFNNSEEVAYLILKNGAVFGELPCLMIAKKQFQLVGGYNKELKHASDIEIILRLINHGKLKFLNKDLLFRRYHPKQKTFSDLKSGSITRDRDILFQKYKHMIKGKKIHIVSASIIARCVYDILRLPMHRSFLVVFEAVRIIFLHIGVSIFYLPTILFEVISKRNIDEI